MCGILGTSSNNSAYECYRGLLAIQHRGQDSAGILSFDGVVHQKKEKGLVLNVFNKEELSKLEGSKAIGHVRYPTAGTNTICEAQPFFLSYPYGIGLAHNGNITNYQELKRELEDKNRCIHSKSDTEVMINVLSEELIKNDTFEAIQGTMERIDGSYATVMLLPKKLIAFRDPYGNRPLVFGEKTNLNETAFSFASESVGLDVNDYSLVRDLLPGEAIVVEDSKVEKRVLCSKGRAHCMFEWVYFSRPDSVIEGKSVYEARIELGRNIEFEGEGDVVIPVPDTARTAALGFSEKYGIKQREGLIKNRYIGRTFIMPTQVSRDIAVRDKLNVIKGEIRGKKVILVDDSIVRGTTSRRIVTMLRNNGAKEVHMISTCPPIKHPCYYGIDMPTENELIAARNTDEVAERIGADSVTYQTIKGLVRAIGLKKEDLCLACLNGNYPTHIPEETMKCLTKTRECERKVDT
jgi:amidophosphoribosyltransferase